MITIAAALRKQRSGLTARKPGAPAASCGFSFWCVARLHLWWAVREARKGLPVPGPVCQPACACHPHLTVRGRFETYLEAVMAHSSISVRGPIDTDAAQFLIGQLRAIGVLVVEPPRTAWTSVDELQYRACAAATRARNAATRRQARTGATA